MKKLILTAIGLVACTSLVHAQGGDISTYLLSADILTSTSSYTSNFTGTATGLAKTAGTSAYYYAVLAATTTSAADTGNPAGADWTPVTADGSSTAIVAESVATGGVEGNGNASGFSSSLTAGTVYDIMVVGWSSNFGTTWAAVSSYFADDFKNDTTITGYAGYSNIGTITPTAAPAAAAPVFGGSGAQDGETILFTVAPTVTPEPTTLALAGLGGLSMLFLRRRKS